MSVEQRGGGALSKLSALSEQEDLSHSGRPDRVGGALSALRALEDVSHWVCQDKLG